MANKHRKRCTMSGHCGSANQKHCEVHFIHSILVILRKKKISVGKDVENLVISFIAGGNIHGPAAMESTWQLSNKLKIELSYELTSSFPRYITKRVENRCSNKNLSTICIELLFEQPKVGNNPNAYQWINRQTKCGISIQGNIIHPFIKWNEILLHATTWPNQENFM